MVRAREGEGSGPVCVIVWAIIEVTIKFKDYNSVRNSNMVRHTLIKLGFPGRGTFQQRSAKREDFPLGVSAQRNYVFPDTDFFGDRLEIGIT